VVNIVRLVMEAGPVITDVEDAPSNVNSRSKEVEFERTRAVDGDFVFKEEEESRASLFTSLTRQSFLKAAPQSTTPGTEEYAMSTPAADVKLQRIKHYCFWRFLDCG
jgi:hypothetical protein